MPWAERLAKCGRRGPLRAEEQADLVCPEALTGHPDGSDPSLMPYSQLPYGAFHLHVSTSLYSHSLGSTPISGWNLS